MSLRHEAPRLTAEQRDAILDLAARLQARHEETTDLDALAEAAEEAGLEPRFVHEAARSLAQPPPVPLRSTTPEGRIVGQAALAGLTVVNALMVLTPLGRIATSPFGVPFLLVAGIVGYLGAKGRLPFWAVPGSIFATLVGTRSFLVVVSPAPQTTLTHNVDATITFEFAVALLVGLVTAAAIRLFTPRMAPVS